MNDASGTWTPAGPAPWGAGRLAGVLVGADGTLSAVSDRTYVRSGADPTAPWQATELPVWASELVWQDAAGVAWLRTNSGLVRWDARD